MKIEKIVKTWMDNNAPSIYAEGLSWYEALIILSTKINDIIDQVNLYFDEDLEVVVTKILNEWVDDGTIQVIISEALQTQIDSLDSKIDDINSDLMSRGVNLLSLGAKMDGSDETDLLQNAVDTYRNVILPRGVIGVSRTIVVPSNCQLVGSDEYINQVDMRTPTIRWIGELERMKTVVRIGGNEVGDEPVRDSSRIIVSNILIDGNNLTGFGMYGTYITNETQVTNVKVINTLEHAFYFAKSWYAYFDKLFAQNNRGNGITFSLPLKLSNGLEFNWTSSAPLEINGVTISNLRCHSNGLDFTTENLYSPFDENIRTRGYGLGIGKANGLFVNNVTAESNGGAGVYLKLDSTVVANLQNFYIENNARYAGLDPATNRTNLLIESAGTSSGIVLDSWYMNYGSGGIHHFGNLNSKITLKSFFQPRFLTSLDGFTWLELRDFIAGYGLYHMAGEHNTDPNITTGCSGYGIVNARYSSQTVSVLPSPANQLVRLRLVDPDSVPTGSVIIRRANGTQNSYGMGNLTGEWWTIRAVNVVEIGFTGGGDVDFEIEVQVLDYQKRTLY